MGRFYKYLFKGKLDRALGPAYPDQVSPADEGKLPPGVAAVAPPAVVAPGVVGAAA